MNPSIIGRVNPYNSPHYKPRTNYIQNKKLYFRWAAIEKYLAKSHYPICESYGFLRINLEDNFLIAQHKPKFRPTGILDWAHYTPKQIAYAIDGGYLQFYYEYMLQDKRSDPNIWKDPVEEQKLKDYYRLRAGK